MHRLPSSFIYQTDVLEGRPFANPDIQRLAGDYCAKCGFEAPSFKRYAPVDDGLQGLVADAYERLPIVDPDPVVAEAWDSFKTQIAAQWLFVKSKGFVFAPWLRDGQPYATAHDLVLDVRKGHLFYNLSPDLAMDRLLALHDLFGHAAGGFGFGPRGEFNTWLTHRALFSGELCRRALTTRYRGQNAWTHYGPHLYGADGQYLNVPSKDRPDPQFKFALLPAWAEEV